MAPASKSVRRFAALVVTSLIVAGCTATGPETPKPRFVGTVPTYPIAHDACDPQPAAYGNRLGEPAPAFSAENASATAALLAASFGDGIVGSARPPTESERLDRGALLAWDTGLGSIVLAHVYGQQLEYRRALESENVSWVEARLAPFYHQLGRDDAWQNSTRESTPGLPVEEGGFTRIEWNGHARAGSHVGDVWLASAVFPNPRESAPVLTIGVGLPVWFSGQPGLADYDHLVVRADQVATCLWPAMLHEVPGCPIEVELRGEFCMEAESQFTFGFYFGPGCSFVALDAVTGAVVGHDARSCGI